MLKIYKIASKFSFCQLFREELKATLKPYRMNLKSRTILNNYTLTNRQTNKNNGRGWQNVFF